MFAMLPLQLREPKSSEAKSEDGVHEVTELLGTLGANRSGDEFAVRERQNRRYRAHTVTAR